MLLAPPAAAPVVVCDEVNEEDAVHQVDKVDEVHHVHQVDLAHQVIFSFPTARRLDGHG